MMIALFFIASLLFRGVVLKCTLEVSAKIHLEKTWLSQWWYTIMLYTLLLRNILIFWNVLHFWMKFSSIFEKSPPNNLRLWVPGLGGSINYRPLPEKNPGSSTVTTYYEERIRKHILFHEILGCWRQEEFNLLNSIKEVKYFKYSLSIPFLFLLRPILELESARVPHSGI